MPIESVCGGCSAVLRVSEEYAGKQAKCPDCGAVYTVPVSTSAARQDDMFRAQPVVPPPDHSWYLQTADRRVFGPITRSALDDWAREGRINDTCLIREGDGGWTSPRAIYPQLLQPEIGNPFPSSTTAPVVAPSQAWAVPHRGGLILGLGLAGLLVNCPILSVMAWVMGSGDLEEIRRGRMDPSGQGATQAGRILGIIITCLWLVGVLALFFFFLVALIAGA